MATVNYSIPDEVKELFNAAFSGKNRSAVVAELMRQAAERELTLRRRREAVEAVLHDRGTLASVDAGKVRDALKELRG
ncbi:MAG: hypothetical protein HYV06_01055 [Deltaproteobacteria bacterium]|nr:hypothetical protein [Deltaproteobacteria bacterium]